MGFSRSHRLANGGADILVERLADGTRLLGPVEDRDGLDGGGNGGDEVLDGEGSEEMDLEDAYFLALGNELIDGLLDGIGAGTHHDDDAIGVGRSDILEKLVGAAGEGGEFIHRLFDDLGRHGIELVDRFAPREIDIGVLAGAADEGLFRE